MPFIYFIFTFLCPQLHLLFIFGLYIDRYPHIMAAPNRYPQLILMGDSIIQ